MNNSITMILAEKSVKKQSLYSQGNYVVMISWPGAGDGGGWGWEVEGVEGRFILNEV